MKFLAEDGTVFLTAEECEEYEFYKEEGIPARQFVEKYLTCYDENHKEIKLPRDFDIAEWWKEMYNIMDDCEYINISSVCPSEDYLNFRDFVRKDYGYYLPLNRGSYKYNWKEMKWEEYK
jgi:hypothetical protein